MRTTKLSDTGGNYDGQLDSRIKDAIQLRDYIPRESQLMRSRLTRRDLLHSYVKHDYEEVDNYSLPYVNLFASRSWQRTEQFTPYGYAAYPRGLERRHTDRGRYSNEHHRVPPLFCRELEARPIEAVQAIPLTLNNSGKVHSHRMSVNAALYPQEKTIHRIHPGNSLFNEDQLKPAIKQSYSHDDRDHEAEMISDPKAMATGRKCDYQLAPLRYPPSNTSKTAHAGVGMAHKQFRKNDVGNKLTTELECLLRSKCYYVKGHSRSPDVYTKSRILPTRLLYANESSLLHRDDIIGPRMEVVQRNNATDFSDVQKCNARTYIHDSLRECSLIVHLPTVHMSTVLCRRPNTTADQQITKVEQIRDIDEQNLDQKAETLKAVNLQLCASYLVPGSEEVIRFTNAEKTNLAPPIPHVTSTANYATLNAVSPIPPYIVEEVGLDDEFQCSDHSEDVFQENGEILDCVDFNQCLSDTSDAHSTRSTQEAESTQEDIGFLDVDRYLKTEQQPVDPLAGKQSPPDPRINIDAAKESQRKVDTNEMNDEAMEVAIGTPVSSNCKLNSEPTTSVATAHRLSDAQVENRAANKGIVPSVVSIPEYPESVKYSPSLVGPTTPLQRSDVEKHGESQVISKACKAVETAKDEIACKVIRDPEKETDVNSEKIATEDAQLRCHTAFKLASANQTARRGLTAIKDKKHRNILHPALIESLFPNVPPVLKFAEDGQKIESLPWEFRRLLRWRPSLLTPLVVKQVLMRSGFRASKLTTATEDLETVESPDWIFYFGKHMRPQVFRSLREYQKVNHFPCSFQLGRKDRLWRNLVQMQNRLGKEGFSYIPMTFCLPTDLEALKHEWDEEGPGQRWILKPPASARGIGVRLITKWAQVPKKRPAIVQKYLGRPYLINESKFDLRIYVYISSINPLRVYVHEDGLVRFASQKYSNSARCLGNRFIHLTNYSINRLNAEYVSNTNDQLAKGHKWSLRAFWTYLRNQGVSPSTVWSNIKDVVVKTAISTESAFNAAITSYCNHSNSVHELFGFDIFLDEDLRPWLLEVNVSPSMHSDSPLDAKIKGAVIKDMLNIAGLRLPEATDTNGPIIVPSHLTKPLHQKSPEDTHSSNSAISWNPDPPGVAVTRVSPPNPRIPIVHEPDEGNDETQASCIGEGDVIAPASKTSRKIRRPSHQWLLDTRLIMHELSRDEKEKRRHYVARATYYELPKPHVGCRNSGSSPNSANHNGVNRSAHQQSGTDTCRADWVSRVLDEFNEFESDGAESSVSSHHRSTNSNSLNEDLETNGNNVAKKPARSMGIGPSSPDLKSYGTSIGKEAVNSRPVSRTKLSHSAYLSPNLTPPHTVSRKISPNSATTVNGNTRRKLAIVTEGILNRLTPSDVRILVNMVDELERTGGFQCVFPPKSAEQAERYLSYFEAPRYTNLLCIAYLQKYSNDKEKGLEMLRKFCTTKIHLKSAVHGDRIPLEHQWTHRRPPVGSVTTRLKAPLPQPRRGPENRKG